LSFENGMLAGYFLRL